MGLVFFFKLEKKSLVVLGYIQCPVMVLASADACNVLVPGHDRGGYILLLSLTTAHM